MYEDVPLVLYGHGYDHTLLGNPFSCMQNVLSGIISVVQCSSSKGTVWKSSSSEDSSLSEGSDAISLELEVSMHAREVT